MQNCSNSQCNLITQDPPFVGYIQDSDYYFDSYSRLAIHEEMLKDKVRTTAYLRAIQQNPQLFADKVVLDVGSGTGILSIFAAKSGAKHVYAIEKASIYIHSKNIIAQNNLSDKITVVNGRVEEVELQVDQVDIIISQWMGYFLLYESMLDSVIFARDKWLKSDGILLPNNAKMYIALLDDTDYYFKKAGFWDNVYGINMQCLKLWVNSEPFIDIINPKAILSNSIKFYEIDIKTVKISDLDFKRKFQLKVQLEGKMNGFIAWFDCDFSHGKNKTVLTTSPYKFQTHWKQTIFYRNHPIHVHQGDNFSVMITVSKKVQNPRELNMVIESSFNGSQLEHFRYHMS